MGALARAYRGAAVVAFVYIQEAHATDEWPISSARLSRRPGGAPVCIAQHAALEDRLAAARQFATDYGVTVARTVPPACEAGAGAGAGGESPASVAVLTDAMRNGFQDTFWAWPIRWYVFQADGAGGAVRVTRIGQPDEASFALEEVVEALAEATGVQADAVYSLLPEQ